jgi:hypothetical protein
VTGPAQPSPGLVMLAVAVRGFGYAVTHLAVVPRPVLERMTSLGAEFTGVRTPVVAACGRRVRSCQPAVVVIEHGPVRRWCCCCARLASPATLPLVARLPGDL